MTDETAMETAAEAMAAAMDATTGSDLNARLAGVVSLNAFPDASIGLVQFLSNYGAACTMKIVKGEASGIALTQVVNDYVLSIATTTSSRNTIVIAATGEHGNVAYLYVDVDMQYVTVNDVDQIDTVHDVDPGML